MKYIIEETTKKEVEITFPLSFKTSDSALFHCFDEHWAVAIYKGLKNIDMTSTQAVMGQYKKEFECSKSDVEDGFNYVRNHIQGLFNPIDTTEMNLPVTETLTDKELINELHRQGGLHGN